MRWSCAIRTPPLALRSFVIRLCNGGARLSRPEVEGKVSTVGAHAVAFSELVGMEFFDATVLLDEIAAAVIKVRSK